MDSYPLEPPTPGPEPLDHLYGSYVSATCLTHFYKTLAAVVPGFDEGRCVTRPMDENISQPRVVEVVFEVSPNGGSTAAASAAAGIADGSLDMIVDSPTGTMSMDAMMSMPASMSSQSRTSTAATAKSAPTQSSMTSNSASSSPPPAPPSLNDIRRDELISRFEQEWDVEIIFQPSSVFRTHKRLAVFDMDSTLIQQEVVDEVARVAGVMPAVAAITSRAMNGELDFETSLRERCRLLKGVGSDVWEKLQGSGSDSDGAITLTTGAADLVRCLKRLGYKTAVLSGGFMPMATWLAEKLSLDYAFANNLEIKPSTDSNGLENTIDDTSSKNGSATTLTGEVQGPIVDAAQKAKLVQTLASKEGISLAQTLVVGDGANDLPMMGIAGLGVAFNAKSRVQLEAPARLNSESLMDVLYLLGFGAAEQRELLDA